MHSALAERTDEDAEPVVSELLEREQEA